MDNYRNGQLETDVTIRNFSSKSVSDKMMVQLRDASGKLLLNETKPFKVDGKETTIHVSKKLNKVNLWSGENLISIRWR